MFDLDNAEIEFECPHCGFTNSVTIGEVKAERVIVCCGCLCNIRLEDHERSAEKSQCEINDALRKLVSEKIEIKITL